METQYEIPGIPAPERKELVISPLSLMQLALERGQVEQLQILQDMHFKQMAREAEVAFNLAMNEAQSEMVRVAPDLQNTETHSKYASYAKLDRVIRPVYIKHGFSLSFDTADHPQPEMIRAVCYVSHRDGHTRRYQADIPADGKGPKGGAVMTKTHAHGAAMQYGQRYLLKYIFNVAIGEDDRDGNGPSMTGEQADQLQEWIDSINSSANLEELDHHFRAAYQANANQTARDAIIKAKDDMRGKLRKVGAR